MLAVLGFVTILLVLALIMSKKVSTLVALIFVPAITGFIAAFINAPNVIIQAAQAAAEKAGTAYVEPVITFGTRFTKALSILSADYMGKGLSSIVATGVMFIFAILFFSTCSDAGVFDPIINRILKFTGEDPIKVCIGTFLIGCICHLDGSGATTFLIAIPACMPLFQKLKMNLWVEATIVALAAGIMNVMPWGGPTVRAAAAMSGGGRALSPGEISLAHHGVLFLDEFPEFHRDVLESLRAPLEDGEVTITRAAGSVTLPSRFMLVGAMNPCRCGWYGHPSGRCRCSQKDVEKYVSKISGPLLDRMDLQVSVPSVEFEAMRRREKAESSAAVRERVNAARDIQKKRFAGTPITCNAYMTAPMVGEFCRLDAAGEKLLKGAFDRLGLTARSHDKLLRVARTIADLDGSEKIESYHLAEAIQYRNTDILRGEG